MLDNSIALFNWQFNAVESSLEFTLMIYYQIIRFDIGELSGLKYEWNN